MVKQIEKTTTLYSAFSAYSEAQKKIKELSLQIEALKQIQQPFKKLINQCVRMNGGEVICGEFKGQIVNKQGYFVSPCDYLLVK